MRKVFSAAALFFLALAVIQMLYLLVTKAGADYGWLGVVVLLSVGLPLLPIAPIAGIFLFPADQMWWQWSFLVLAYGSHVVATGETTRVRVSWMIGSLIFFFYAIGSMTQLVTK
jgi:hypothetical protein